MQKGVSWRAITLLATVCHKGKSKTRIGSLWGWALKEALIPKANIAVVKIRLLNSPSYLEEGIERERLSARRNFWRTGC